MGNDGGSIPKRTELVKEAARGPTTEELKATREHKLDHLWNVDPLTKKPLEGPICSDALGRLFSKESLLEFLLESRRGPEFVKPEQEALLKGTVAGLDDVVDVKFEVDQAATAAKNGRLNANEKKELWKCPITGKILGPANKAIYLVPCGHAFAASALKEIPSETCLVCDTSFAPNDIIPIFPTDELDIARLSLRLRTLKEKGLTHSLAKARGKKKKRRAIKEDCEEEIKNLSADATATHVVASSTSSTSISSKKTIEPTTPNSSTINNSATASLTAKVLTEQDQRNKRRKVGENDNIRSLYTSSGSKNDKPKDIDFMTRGVSLRR